MPPGTVLPDTDVLKHVKYIVRCGIENISTNLVIHAILQSHITAPCPYNLADQTLNAGCSHCCQRIVWPGATFDIGFDKTRALLGTPIGFGVAWLFAQHAELVGKRVRSVRVWCDVTKVPLTPNLLLDIDDANVEDEGCGEDVEDVTEKLKVGEAGDGDV